MKPANFDYYAPSTLEEVLTLLQQYGDEAKILAGGQSLMPLMNMRLARPSVVIDINRVSELEHISPSDDGGLSIGALTRERAVELSGLVQERTPLLSVAMPFIGHFQIRNRGTIGGSIAHADPAAELPALSLALQAELVLKSSQSQRLVQSKDFFMTYFTTATEPTEILTEVKLPAWPSGWEWGFEEVCRRDGDFALVGAIAMLHLDENQACDGSRIVLFGVEGAPVRMPAVEEMLMGRRVDQKALEEVGKLVAEEIDPPSDLHASDEYRKEVAGVLARRILEAASTRARERSRP